MAMLYPDLTTALVILAQQYDARGVYTFLHSPNFTAYLPRVIEYAEGRVYREVVPLATRNSSATAQVQAGLRTLPLGFFVPQPVVVEHLALITPQGVAPQKGQRWVYEMTSIDFIDMIWPVEATTMAPNVAYPELYCAPLDNQTFVLAPTPDLAYTAEVTGTFRPMPLSAANPQTYLTSFYPDIFLAACMIAVAGFQRDFGAQSDDPRMAVSWESVYEKLLPGAIEEEQRRRGQGVGWGQLPPAVEAKQARA